MSQDRLFFSRLFETLPLFSSDLIYLLLFLLHSKQKGVPRASINEINIAAVSPMPRQSFFQLKGFMRAVPPFQI